MLLPKKYQQALDIFVSKKKRNPNVLGVLVAGSVLTDVPDKNSDIDVYLILNKSATREKGNTWINGIEIEYFANPVIQIKEYFKTEYVKSFPSTAHMFTTGEVVFSRDDAVMKSLIQAAKKAMRVRLPAMSKLQLELAKYAVDDLFKDLEDVYLRKNWFAFAQALQELQTFCLATFFSLHRVSKEKAKRLEVTLESLDSAFYKTYRNSLLASTNKEKLESAKRLTASLEKLLGGKRTKEWRLRSKCTVHQKN